VTTTKDFAKTNPAFAKKPMSKFIQIAIGEYETTDGRKQHCVYALNEAGFVYKFEVNNGWIQLKKRESPSTSVQRRTFVGPPVSVEDDDF
jgi:hypothetical protein